MLALTRKVTDRNARGYSKIRTTHPRFVAESIHKKRLFTGTAKARMWEVSLVYGGTFTQSYHEGAGIDRKSCVKLSSIIYGK